MDTRSHAWLNRTVLILAPFSLAKHDKRLAVAYGRLLATLRSRGETISTMDLLIAAAAVVDDVPLVTRNTRDFERVPSLEVIGY